MKQVTITGMSCEHCASAVKNALLDLGLKNVSVNLVSGVAIFDADARLLEPQVREAIEEAGFEVAAVE